MSGQEGTAFILTNDAMPGFARVEFTTKDDLANKIKKINRSDLPIPFRLYFAAKVNDCDLVDRNLHYLFSDHCDTRDARFFRINPDRLRVAIELAATAPIAIDDDDIGISPEMRARMDQIKASHDASRFGAFSAAPGTVLYFTKDTTITCTALGNGMVEFEGKATTPAEATRDALKAIGFDWDEAFATDYWLTQSVGPAGHGRSAESSQAAAHVAEEFAVLATEPDDSPVMFIRNRKI
ncbi:GIY-YIG nuclease family protein [Altererythrobacter sp. BO-6]|uniref:GIY-YIG nuclease family protein n=1 Tax=Altererythrobacter sp. BO-6 TaxID=2604537 RepID=UPI0013E1985E|nr:GIY-YIG nuclease family protein [Altererythrobacter sp. BO-6]QIG53205.1 GIY-YIG nuclease family protein [Altererythrobacter sp. BO-6]